MSLVVLQSVYNDVMRFTVPQFIEIEDRIFGPLTWKQFLYVGGGFGMAVVIFMIFPFYVFVLVGLPIGGLAAALAFFPVNNRPFSVFLESIFTYFMSNRRYFWRHEKERVYKEKRSADSAPTPTPVAKPGGGGLAALSRKLELESLQKDEEF